VDEKVMRYLASTREQFDHRETNIDSTHAYTPSQKVNAIVKYTQSTGTTMALSQVDERDVQLR